jgi:hypothetical protein
MLNIISLILKWLCWPILRTLIHKKVLAEIFDTEEEAFLVSDATTVSF